MLTMRFQPCNGNRMASCRISSVMPSRAGNWAAWAAVVAAVGAGKVAAMVAGVAVNAARPAPVEVLLLVRCLSAPVAGLPRRRCRTPGERVRLWSLRPRS